MFKMPDTKISTAPFVVSVPLSHRDRLIHLMRRLHRYFGNVIDQDYAQALRWYYKGAEQGHPQAQYNLGVMYHKGQGVPRDDVKALRWLCQAAEQGVAEAQHDVGTSYAKGRGVPQDYVLAYMWLNLAAAQGVEQAAIGRNTVAKRMPLADLSKAQGLAREWLEMRREAN